MVTVPAEIPRTTPDELIVATVVLLLLQVPPETPSTSVVVTPGQTVVEPEMLPADGVVFTVMDCVAVAVPQLLVAVYEMVTVPAVTPLTTPEAFMVAIAVLLLVHVPPATASDKVTVAPVHSVEVPVIVPALGAGLTVTVSTALAEPQVLVIV